MNQAPKSTALTAKAAQNTKVLEKAATSSTASNASSGENVKKKPGNQGDFHGQRFDFLEGKYGSYALASLQGTQWVRNWYNNTLFPEYWAKFHWSLPIDREPSPTDELPDDKALTKEQTDEKARVLNIMVPKIKAWFNQRRHSSKLNSRKNVWAPWLNQLRDPGDPPRRRHDYQVYMSHPAFKDKVAKAFDASWKEEVDQDKSRRMKFQCDIAKKLLREEPVEVRAALDQEEEERYQLARKKYDLGVSAASLSSAEDRDEAIATLAAVVQPLLDGIRAHTGMYIGLTGVLPAEDASEMQCVFLSSGKSTEGQDFSAQDPNGFRQFTKLFLRWSSVAAGVLSDSALKQSASNSKELASAPSTPAVSPSKPMPRASLATTSMASTSSSTSSSTSNMNSTPKPTPELASVDRHLRLAMDDVSQRLADAGAKGKPNEALLASVARMVPGERDRRIKELAKMGEYEFRCANGISYKNAALARLGFKSPPPIPDDIRSDDEPFDDAAYAPEDADANPPSSPSSRRTTRLNTKQPIAAIPSPAATSPVITTTAPNPTQPTAVAHTPIETPTTPIGTPTTLPDPVEVAHTPIETPTTLPNPVEVPDAPMHGDVDRDAMDIEPSNITPVPVWFSAAFEAFDSVDRSVYGSMWFDAIRAWGDIEQRCKYEANGKSLSTTSRPPQIALWVKNARYKNVYVKIPTLDTKTFEKHWWAWWIHVNPSWRTRIGNKRLSREGPASGSWSCIAATGVNGLINVLVSLWWWREKMPDSSPLYASWKEAVTDVAYALTATRAELLSANDQAPPPKKRQRTA